MRDFDGLVSAVVVLGQTCEFPPDHPLESLPAEAPIAMFRSRVYTYYDTFGGCHGCIAAVTFCYQPGNKTGEEELMIIQIRKNGNGNVEDNYTVIVRPEEDRGNNCLERYNLGQGFCCVQQNLSESFKVEHMLWYFSLHILEGSVPEGSSALVRHRTETVDNTSQTHLNGMSILEDVYKPYLFFIIDPNAGMLSL